MATSNEELFRRPIRPEKYCSEFTLEHGMTDPPAHKFCFGVVCPRPRCEQTIPMAVETPSALTRYLRCSYCRWCFMLDLEAFERFVAEVQANE